MRMPCASASCKSCWTSSLAVASFGVFDWEGYGVVKERGSLGDDGGGFGFMGAGRRSILGFLESWGRGKGVFLSLGFVEGAGIE